jgi:dihydrofolate synthase/folylpolyglutamate synthase
MAMAESLPEPFRPDAEAVAAGLQSARLPGRFERRGPWLFDVAHHPDGMRALIAALRAEQPSRPLVAVVAILADKEWREMLTLLAPAVDRLVLTCAPSAPEGRAWELEEVADWAALQGLAAATEPDLAAALALGRRAAATVLVTGSFHTVGDAMAALPGLSPLG